MARSRNAESVARILRETLDCPSGPLPSVKDIVNSGFSDKVIERRLRARRALVKLEKEKWRPRSSHPQTSSPRTAPPPKGRWIYRAWSASDSLLYVGITDRGRTREREHARTKPWWAEVHHVTYQRVHTRAELRYLEAEAIRREKPLYNIQHNGR